MFMKQLPAYTLKIYDMYEGWKLKKNDDNWGNKNVWVLKTRGKEVVVKGKME